MSNNVFWAETKRLNILSKLRNTITIPAFCARCGEDNGSLDFTSRESGSFAYSILGNTNFATDTTFEILYKTFSSFQNSRGIIFSNVGSLGGTNIYISFYQRKVELRVKKGGVYTSLFSFNNFKQAEWGHLAVTYDGVIFKIYLDGIQDSNTLTISGIDTSSNNNYQQILGGPEVYVPGELYIGHIAEFRYWSRVLSKSEIKNGINKRRGKNINLDRYVRFNISSTLGAATIYRDFITSARYFTVVSGSTNPQLDTVDYPSLISGASPLAAVFDIVAGQNISLKYPIKKPSGAEFTMCVSYVDDDTDTRIRYRLWDDVLDLAPFPERYRGQILPSSFRFEAFGRDGAEDADMDDDLEIQFSHCSIPTNQRDTDNVALTTNPTADTTLGVAWGSAFPLTFNTAQFGTCAAPVSQTLANMSSNLTVYGGTGGVAGAILTEQGGNILDEGGNQIVTEN